ncbi:hypothetical protein [Gimibacter soli]|uniref:Uncharacterized protein n=1 Tax=Gimibacter soli TaxID=3024400 RepID=A0AAE9XUE3_9PROT|nr:hypothetical protein [Gimibacter soli]WCL55540.1 hypothetical protein PH603_07170 [Gimibacter soli]
MKITKHVVDAISLGQKAFDLEVDQWVRPQMVKLSRPLEEIRSLNRAYLLGDGFGGEETVDQDIVDYMAAYLRRTNAITDEEFWIVLDDIAWVAEQMLSSYALELLDYVFSRHVTKERIDQTMLRLKALYSQSSPLLNSSWRNFILDASHVNEWSDEQVREVLSGEAYGFVKEIRAV